MSLDFAIDKFLKAPGKESERELLAQLKSSEFITAVFFAAPLANPNGEPVYDEQNFSFISLDDGASRYVPAFSSQKEFSLWQGLGEHEKLELSLKELSLAISSLEGNIAGIVIDPFSSSLILNTDKLKAIFEI